MGKKTDVISPWKGRKGGAICRPLLPAAKVHRRQRAEDRCKTGYIDNYFFNRGRKAVVTIASKCQGGSTAFSSDTRKEERREE